MKFERGTLHDQDLLDIYKRLVMPRQIEEKMLIYLRQGKISKWFSGYGQEAISVGCALALEPDEYILTMHRNLGVFTSRDVPLERLFAQFMGKNEGFTNGRDRSFHFGSKEHHIVGMISHLGPQLGIADGIALAQKIGHTGKTTLVFTGDGGASEGDFHEALNVAAVWDLPVIFVIENNQWGLSTPSNEQFRCKQLIDKGIGYGMEAVQVDGNNILDVRNTIHRLAEGMRKDPKPVMVECITFRMRGHEEASGTKYYPEGIQDEWSKKDPITRYEEWLMSEGIISIEEIEKIKNAFTKEIGKAFEHAGKFDPVEVSLQKELEDVYAHHDDEVHVPGPDAKEIRFVDAISEGLDEAMRRYDDLVLMGQDIGTYGGVFKVTEGMIDRYGTERVRNTPLCESAILGAGLGLSIAGKKAMVEMQFADFVSSGFNQIVNNLAKIHWRWGQNADVVVRMPTGAGVGAGPYHSQSNESWFFHTPGLKILYPSSPEDAKGLLLAAFEDPNPVMFFEHKKLYRSLTGNVPEGYYTTPIGKAKVVSEGSDVSIITYGLGVHWALELKERFNEQSMEIIDLRSLAPLDWECVFASSRKTGKVFVLHEDNMSGGIGAELSARITEECFESLDAPIVRCAALDTPVPFASDLEEQFLPTSRMFDLLQKLIEY